MSLQHWRSTTRATAGLRHFSFPLVVAALGPVAGNSSYGGHVIFEDSSERPDAELK